MARLATRRRVPGPVAVVLAVLVAGGLFGGCAGDPVAPPGQALVATRIIPRGQLLEDVLATGAARVQPLPPELTGGDVLVTPDEAERCLVAGADLPQGSVLRRSQFIPPSDLGVTEGFAVGGSVPPLCRVPGTTAP